MKKLITLFAILVSTAQAQAILDNTVVRYEFGQDIYTMDVPSGTYDVINVTVSAFGEAHVVRTRLNDRIPGRNVLQMETVRLSHFELEALHSFVDEASVARLEKRTFLAVCEKYPSRFDMINNLYINKYNRNLLVDTSHDCTVGHQVQLADKELHEDAHAIKEFLHQVAAEALGLSDTTIWF